MGKKQITVTLPEILIDRLQKIVNKTGITISNIIVLSLDMKKVIQLEENILEVNKNKRDIKK